jgi:uncharacterized membrane protein
MSDSMHAKAVTDVTVSRSFLHVRIHIRMLGSGTHMATRVRTRKEARSRYKESSKHFDIFVFRPRPSQRPVLLLQRQG